MRLNVKNCLYSLFLKRDFSPGLSNFCNILFAASFLAARFEVPFPVPDFFPTETLHENEACLQAPLAACRQHYKQI